MKKLVIGFLFFQINTASFGQRNSVEINVNSKEFYRVFDGFLLQEDCVIPKDVHLNSIWRSSDDEKLKKMGLKKISKPYMFMNSLASPIRELIYQKASVSAYFQEINFPIILNKKVITYRKYDLLDRIDSSTISEVKYLKPDESFLVKHPNMPLGAVVVTTTRR